MRTIILVITLSCCLCLLPSCDQASALAPEDTPTLSGEPPQLYGARWVAETLVYQGKDYSVLGNGKDYSVEFSPDKTYTGVNSTTEGKVNGTADCNTFKADFSVNNQTRSLRLLNYIPTTDVCDSFSLAFTQALPQSIAFAFPTKDLLRIDLLSSGYILLRRVLNPANISPSAVNTVNFRNFIFPQSDSFNIRTITISGDTLRIDVGYKGCFAHPFTLFTDNTFANTSVVSTYIQHNANGDTCSDERTESLFFDLAPLRNEYRRVTGRRSGSLKLRFSAGLENITLIWEL